MSANTYPNWLGTIPAAALALPGNTVTVNGQTNSTVNLVATCPALTISTTQSFASATTWYPQFRFGVSTGVYLCGATTWTSTLNGAQWQQADAFGYRIVDSNRDVLTRPFTIYPELDLRPHYTAATTTSSANNNMCGIFSANSNLWLTWEVAATASQTAYPVTTHAANIEAPWFQRIDGTPRTS